MSERARQTWATIVFGVTVGGCGFTPTITSKDAPIPDVPVLPDVINVTWMIDATSHKAVPTTSTQWGDLVAAYGLASSPTHVWQMQETSGVLADSIGAVSLMPMNGPSYATGVAGWSRTAVSTITTAANQSFSTLSLGNLDGTSYMVLAYVRVATTPPSERSLLGVGANTDHRYVSVTAAPVIKGTGIGVTPTLGTVDPKFVVHPIVMKLDETHHVYTVYSDEEKLDVTWAPTSGAGSLITFGNAIIGTVQADYLYGALWSGPGAEVADAEVKKLFQALGWTVSGF